MYGTVTRSNVLVRMTDLAVHAIKAYGTVGAMLHDPHFSMPLSGEELNKAQQSASKIVGWLFLCLDPSLQATLKNENAIFPKAGETWIQCLKKMIITLKNNVEVTTQASMAALAMNNLWSLKLAEEENIEVFYAKWSAALTALNMFYATPTPDAHAVSILLNALRNDTSLYTRIMDHAPDGNYSNVHAVIEFARKHRNVRDSMKRELAMTAAETSVKEISAPAIVKKAESAKTGEAHKAQSCVYCSAKLGKPITSHWTFSSKGKLCCRRLANDIMGEGLLEEAKEVVSNFTNKSSKYPLALISQIRHSHFHHDTVIADCGATKHIFNDKKWFRSIEDSKPSNIIGIGGGIDISAQGDTVFGHALLCENLPFSLVSTNQVHDDKKRGKNITLDWNKDDNTIVVTVGEQTHTFRTNSKLNVPHCIISPNIDIASIALPTIASAEDMRKALRARDLHYSLNHVPDSTLIRTLKTNGISGCNVSHRDVVLAHDVLGPCPVCKAARGTLNRGGGQYEPAHLPGEHLRCDVVFFRGTAGIKRPYLLAVDEATSAMFVEPLDTSTQRYTANQLSDAIERICSYFKLRNMPVEKVYADADIVTKASEQRIATLGAILMQWPTGQHEPVAENAQRTLSADMRAVLAHLPYRLPESLTGALAQDCAMTRRLVSNTKCPISTPYVILEGREPYAHAYEIPFGALVLVADAHRDPSKHLDPRAEYGIVVARHLDIQYKCEVYMLDTKRIVSRTVKVSDLIPAPYPKPLIDKLNHNAKLRSDDQIITRMAQIPIAKSLDPHQALSDTITNVRSSAQTNAQTNNNTEEKTTPSEASTTPSEAPIHQVQQTALPEPASHITRSSQRIRDRNNNTNLDQRPFRTTAKDRRNKNKSSPDEADIVSPPDEADIVSPLLPVAETDEVNDIKITDDEKADDDSMDVTAFFDNKKHIALAMFFTALLEPEKRDYTLNQLLQLGEEGENAVIKEIKNIIDHGSWKPIKADDLTHQQKREAITSFIFGKRKLTGQLKGRLVKNGAQQQKREEYKNLFSPTSNPMTTMAHLAVASYEKRKFLFSADFPGAYLKVDREKHEMPDEYTRLTGRLAQIVIKASPDFAKYMTPQGAIYCKIMRSVYGLIESAALWFRQLRDLLVNEGFVQMINVDPCLFVHPVTGAIINIHVDDCLISCTTQHDMDHLMQFFNNHNCAIHIDKFLFLGMNIERTQHGIIVSMTSLIEDRLKQWKIAGYEQYPHRPQLLEAANSPPLDDAARATYVSRVMSLLYCGLRARFDILYTLSILSQNCAKPTAQNMLDLDHLLRYVNATTNKAMLINPKSLDLHVYADSSYMSHPDRKGHTGTFVTVGELGTVISAKSTKQKMQASSSTEGEIISSFESLPQLRLAAALLDAMGHPSVPILHQDNMSAIHMMESGRGTSAQTKHFGARLNILNELIASDDMRTIYTPDTEMPADLLTKPVTGTKFKKFINTFLSATN